MAESAIMIGLYAMQIARENEMTLLAWAIGLVGAASLGLYLMRNRK